MESATNRVREPRQNALIFGPTCKTARGLPRLAASAVSGERVTITQPKLILHGHIALRVVEINMPDDQNETICHSRPTVVTTGTSPTWSTE
jgi:hypothetical protein